MTELRMPDLELRAERLAAEIVATVGRGWRWRLAAGAAGVAAVVVLAGALASLLR